jgi:protein-L-isoaspartate(D-aspartate) O-methyltransferase
MDAEHKAMVAVLRGYKIQDARVLEAMARVRRHVYIPEELRDHVDPYGDHPCPIGFGQTISQPFIVAYMTQRMELKPGAKILEIGTGSGYQAAVLAELGAEVYSVEIVPELADHARRALAAEGYGSVKVRTGDGYQGWPEHAPFDSIIVTCAPNQIPPKLVEQLKDGGRMILPVGSGIQQLVVLDKSGDTFREVPDMYVRFVPMVKGSDD